MVQSADMHVSAFHASSVQLGTSSVQLGILIYIYIYQNELVKVFTKTFNRVLNGECSECSFNRVFIIYIYIVLVSEIQKSAQ